MLSHVWAYKRQREAARRMNFYNGEVASKHPPFPEGSGASLTTPAGQDLTYSAADDELIKTFVRERVGTISHGLGTCRMAPEVDGPRPGGVVDDRLRVHGVVGLRIADASMFPHILSTHLAAPVVAVAEKCADMVKEDWMKAGRSKVTRRG